MHCCGTDRKGKFQIVRLTAKKRMRAMMTAIRDALYRKRHEPVPAVGAWLKPVMNGYFEYHAVPTNLKRLEGSVPRCAAHRGMPCCVGASATGYAGSVSIALPVSTFRHAGFDILIQRSAFFASRP